MEKLSVIILAGGNSNRFGVPKPFLSFDKNFSFLEKIVNEYLKFECEEIIIVINQIYSEIFSNNFSELLKSKINVIYNNKTELGRFYSLKIGAASVSDSDYCFIQNIDNPFTDQVTLQRLYDNRKGNAYISPVHLNRGGHPVLLPGLIIDMIKKETDINLNTKDFLSRFNKITVEVENDKILANINTPYDYEMFFKKPV
jgi:CTP:molybdopterin cytidylyltransferase MocA